MAGKSGTCGFCGYGDGWLGDQGDESTVYLPSVVRVGDSPDEWKYERHPNALPDYGSDEDKPGQSIIWCGNCVGGLKHLWQREDDQNLNAEKMALGIWLELDGLRWEAHYADKDSPLKKLRDDPAIHLDKMRRERRYHLAEKEQFRRAGVDLTTRGWRP